MLNTQNITIAIDKKTIASLPTVAFQGEIIVVDSVEKADEAVTYLEQHPIIGFDTETKPSFKKGHPNKVALMQLSTLDRCYLFRLNVMGFPDSLCRLIENENVQKIGLSVRDDFHVMHRSSEFNPMGFVELQNFVKQFKIADISLQKIYAIIFGRKISKGQRLTNWEAPALTRPQQVYAATDAWACLTIYNHLNSGAFVPEQSKYIVVETDDNTSNAAE